MKIQDKLISVVIPAYNAANTITRTIDSVYNQTYRNLEVIVVNDGSTDNTLELVTQYKESKKDINIIIIDKTNGGVSTARNAGMKVAKGDFIALLDADDFWSFNKIERQLEIFTQYPNIDFLGTNRNNEYFRWFLFKKFSKITVISAKFLLLKWFFVTPTVMFKKKILNSVGDFDESQKYAEEGNYWLRVCKDNCCALLNESLVTTGDGKPHFGHSGLSGNLIEMQKGEYKNLKDALNLKIVNLFEYAFLVVYSTSKYVRRILIVKTRR